MITITIVCSQIVVLLIFAFSLSRPKSSPQEQLEQKLAEAAGDLVVDKLDSCKDDWCMGCRKWIAENGQGAPLVSKLVTEILYECEKGELEAFASKVAFCTLVLGDCILR